MPTWYQGKIKYQEETVETTRQGDQVKLKTITEVYLLDSVSYTDAEARLYQLEAKPDFTVAGISKMRLSDVFECETGEIWFKCKVVFTTEDDKGREKKLTQFMLINAGTVKDAYDKLEQQLKTILMPYEIHEIIRTPILEVIPYQEPEQTTV